MLQRDEICGMVGEMDNPRSYADIAQRCQVLIQCASERTQRLMDVDRKATESLLQIAGESHLPRIVIYSSGAWVYGNTFNITADESSALNPPSFLRPRVETERLMLEADSGLLRSIVIRPGIVYGRAGGLTGLLFREAADRGSVRVIDNGDNVWAMVHVDDLADLYLRAAESAIGGEIFNASDGSRFSFRDCAAASLRASGGNGAAVESMSMEEAMQNLGPFAEGMAQNLRLDSGKAARLLNWRPRHPNFVDGVERYCRSWEMLEQRG